MSLFPLLLFVVLPIAELMVIIKVGAQIGALNTILTLISASIFGWWVTKYQGFVVLARLQESVNRGVSPNKELMDGAMILVGGILFLIPGFLSDMVGILFLFPLSRALITYILKRKFVGMKGRGEIVNITSFGGRKKDGYQDIDI